MIPGVRGKRGVRTSPAGRMWRRVVSESDGCLIFTGSKDAKGYGQVTCMDAGRPLKAHRVAWESTVGPIPDGLCVLHRCDNPACVNPDHLFLGTVGDNNTDMTAKGRHANQQKTHCPAGHLYDETRLCRVCRRLRYTEKVARGRASS
jgi:hypothetical protein